jgi:threonylcarbamoyladenosine tRNA methylthiotransferase MtaB
MVSAAFYTLGCKLNQLETESIAAAFRAENFAVSRLDEAGSAEKLSLIIINTCTVTSHAEQKVRRAIRKALRDYPGAVLIVTGCYAQLDAEAIEALEETAPGEGRRLFVVPGGRKAGILDLARFLGASPASGGPGVGGNDLRDLVENWAGNGDGFDAASAFRFSPADFSFHSRAFVKIQDGCDNRCAYCRVSIARGKSCSLGAEAIAEVLRCLEDRGYNEAVLTGVNISQYAAGEGGRRPGLEDLGVLLEYLMEKTKTIRLRLSSIEPDVFSPVFVRAVSHERVRPHFHLSLQSGSDAVLSRMGRHYSSAEAAGAVEQLRGAKGDPFFACDVIAGFPGETAADFEKTLGFCQKAGFAWIHAFPFSRRPGTAAWDFKDRVSEAEAGRRVALLSDLARQGRRVYVDRWIGRELEVIAEKSGGKTPGFISGVAENYLKVIIPVLRQPEPKAGEILRCRLVKPPGGSVFDAGAEIL